MREKGPRWISLFVIVATCFYTIICQADERRILGEVFNVDEISEVDSGTVELVLFGDRRIISKEKLDVFIVKEYFKELENFRGISTEKIEKFVERGAKDQQIELAFPAFAALLLRSRKIGEPTDVELERLILNISAFEGGFNIFKEALAVTEKRLYSKKVLGALLIRVGENDLEWLRTNAASLVYLEGQAFKDAATQTFIRATKDKDYQRARKIVGLLEELFGKEDKAYTRLKFALNRIEQVLKVTEDGRIEDLYPLVESSLAEPLLAEIIFPVLIETFHTQAERLILAGDPATALVVLSRIGPDRRTPTTHELAGRALDILTPSKDLIIRDWSLEVMLKTLAQNDPLVGGKYLTFLEAQTRYLIQIGNQGEANFCFSKLISARPDPNRANDAIRAEIALSYLKRGERALANAKMGEVRTFLSLGNRVKLLMAGYYVEGKIVWAFCVIVVLLAFYILKVRERLSRVSSRVERSDNGVESDPERVVGGFNMAEVRGTFNPRFEEYKRCLKVLGLVPQASLRDIKWAYRNGVKEVHPDSAEVGASTTDSLSFIQLTDTYERILELRKELGMGDE